MLKKKKKKGKWFSRGSKGRCSPAGGGGRVSLAPPTAPARPGAAGPSGSAPPRTRPACAGGRGGAAGPISIVTAGAGGRRRGSSPFSARRIPRGAGTAPSRGERARAPAPLRASPRPAPPPPTSLPAGSAARNARAPPRKAAVGGRGAGGGARGGGWTGRAAGAPVCAAPRRSPCLTHRGARGRCSARRGSGCGADVGAPSLPAPAGLGSSARRRRS